MKVNVGKLSLGDAFDKVGKEVTSSFDFTAGENGYKDRYSLCDYKKDVYIDLKGKDVLDEIRVKREVWEY